MSCEIAERESSSEYTVDSMDIKGNKTIYLHLKKFFSGARFTFRPFLQSIQSNYKEGQIVCVSGKVSFTSFSIFYLFTLLYPIDIFGYF